MGQGPKRPAPLYLQEATRSSLSKKYKERRMHPHPLVFPACSCCSTDHKKQLLVEVLVNFLMKTTTQSII